MYKHKGYSTSSDSGCAILFGVLWLLGTLFSLAALAAVVYVAWHFLSKIW
jgi:hypothetical protein